ncbi:GNAT family acetyltransferase [Tateyamaria omphalii]|uniref:GNAT family N-acetyltransferase n=1 Tax=Tateyamaria omphalii TaxID=299262 RepID=UPI0016765B65|nr:GNAT family N-acetyltransferase [Tateyamaria omphalii]GGX44222.1 GNAT family acetyltransferase [Tateyamaria omphalii]
MKAAPTLRTDRLTLRQPQAGDLSVYATYCASDRTKFVGGPFDQAKAFDKLAAIAGHWTLRGFGRYIMERDGAPIGHVGPMQLDDTQPPELTWTLWDGAYEGQGFATEAANRVRNHVLGDLGWPQVVIHIMPDNSGSIGIAERIGAIRTDVQAPAWYEGAVVYQLAQEVAI